MATAAQLRRDVLAGSLLNEEQIAILLGIAIDDINAAAKRYKNNTTAFERRALAIIALFWASYVLLTKNTHRNIGGIFASYVDDTIGVSLDKAGASKTLAALKKETATFADDVAKAVLTRKSPFDGLTITSRINTLKKGSERIAKEILKTGIARGLSVNELAVSLQRYIDPESLSGKTLTRGNSVNYKSIQRGMNVPKGAIKYNAVRISRSEIMQTYDRASDQFYQNRPWIKGWDWILSNTHAVPDDCNTLAAQSPHKTIPQRPHPQCMCDVRPQVMNVTELSALVRSGKLD